jgi:hypothetical protein
LPFSASRRPKAPEGAGALDRFSSHTILAHNFNRLFAPNKDNLVLRVNYFWAARFWPCRGRARVPYRNILMPFRKPMMSHHNLTMRRRKVAMLRRNITTRLRNITMACRNFLERNFNLNMRFSNP